jgi:hypothetical protein
MAEGRLRNLLFWSVPASIAVVAGYFAYRYFREPAWAPPEDASYELRVNPCAVGRQRCVEGAIQESTGERADAGTGGEVCAWKTLERCAKACVADRVTMAGLDAATTKKQLCDPPESVASLIAEQTSNLDKRPDEVPSCEGDGYAPTSTEIVQCVLRSAKDRGALGVVIGTIRCRTSVVATMDRAPQLISREQAVALWCARGEGAGSGAGSGAASGSAAASASASAAASASASASAPASGSASASGSGSGSASASAARK